MYKQCSAQERPLYTTPFRLTIRLTFSSWIESHIRWTVPASDAGVEARAGPGSTSTDGILFYVFANLARHLSVSPSPAAAGVSLSYGSALPGRSGGLRKTPVRPSALVALAIIGLNASDRWFAPSIILTASIQATTSPATSMKILSPALRHPWPIQARAENLEVHAITGKRRGGHKSSVRPLSTTSSGNRPTAAPLVGLVHHTRVVLYRRRWFWEIAKQRLLRRKSPSLRSRARRIDLLRDNHSMENHVHSQMDEGKMTDDNVVTTADQAGECFLKKRKTQNYSNYGLKHSRQPVLSASHKKSQSYLMVFLILLPIFTVAGTGAPVSTTIWCVECEDVAASVFCENCKDHFCGLCFQWQHRSGNRASHVSKPLPGQSAHR